MKYLIVGLGNPGSEYFHTRHNIGFILLDAFVKASSSFFVPARLADVAKVNWKGKQITCVKPSTFMNLSGKSLRYWMQVEHIPLENILVLTDDLALEIGSMKLKPKGSDGGHNGLKDIAGQLNTQEYARLRFGIGHDFLPGKQSDYVLGNFSVEEQEIINLKIPIVIDLIKNFVSVGLMRTMNLMNKELK